jgi:hypothetical protein
MFVVVECDDFRDSPVLSHALQGQVAMAASITVFKPACRALPHPQADASSSVIPLRHSVAAFDPSISRRRFIFGFGSRHRLRARSSWPKLTFARTVDSEGRTTLVSLRSSGCNACYYLDGSLVMRIFAGILRGLGLRNRDSRDMGGLYKSSSGSKPLSPTVTSRCPRALGYQGHAWGLRFHFRI